MCIMLWRKVNRDRKEWCKGPDRLGQSREQVAEGERTLEREEMEVHRRGMKEGLCAAWKFIARTLAFTLRQIQNHWRVWNKGEIQTCLCSKVSLLLCCKVICWRGLQADAERPDRRWPRTPGVRLQGFAAAEMKELRHVKTLDEFWR